MPGKNIPGPLSKGFDTPLYPRVTLQCGDTFCASPPSSRGLSILMASMLLDMASSIYFGWPLSPQATFTAR